MQCALPQFLKWLLTRKTAQTNVMNRVFVPRHRNYPAAFQHHMSSPSPSLIHTAQTQQLCALNSQTCSRTETRLNQVLRPSAETLNLMDHRNGKHPRLKQNCSEVPNLPQAPSQFPGVTLPPASLSQQQLKLTWLPAAPGLTVQLRNTSSTSHPPSFLASSRNC